MGSMVRMPAMKVSSRFKGKGRVYPSVPNQPSEALAHFMFELAKQVLTKAGGNSSTSVFNQLPANGQNPRGPHKALHMCAFQLGLYALGLHNRVQPNWATRTYSSHVSWITGREKLSRTRSTYTFMCCHFRCMLFNSRVMVDTYQT